MKEISLFPGEGKFYKVNLHCHSTYSDGRMTVERLKEEYKKRGYSAVAFSDHNVLKPHNEFSDDEFIAINAIEIDYNQDSSAFRRGWNCASVYHLNFFSKDKNRTEFIPFDRVYSKEAVQKTIDDANAAGFLVMYNHPRWSYQSEKDFADLKGLFGFEVFNTGCEITMIDGWGDYEYDSFCRRGGDAAVTATDDNHNCCEDFESPYSDSFGGWTMIKADELTYGALFDAMEKKNCYASTGASFKSGRYFRDEDGSVVVKGFCEPVSEVFALTDGRPSDARRSFNDDIGEFTFTLPKETEWFRLELRNKQGGRALTKRYLVSELD